MYSVSESYISSMTSDLREMPSFSVLLFNPDLAANSLLSLVFSPQPLQEGRDLTAFNRLPLRTRRATLEYNLLQANGQCSTDDTGYYIGAGVSSGTPNENGLYVYEVPDIIVVTTPGSRKPVSFLLDATIAEVEIVHTDSTVETVSFVADGTEHTLSVKDYGAGKITLEFKSSFFPFQRPKVYGIYAADVFAWGCDDIEGVSLDDENDLMCLELPSRKVELTISNLDGKLDPYGESIAPSFYRKTTQAFLIFYYNGELVPIGRLFLDKYAVDRQKINFSFDWAMLPLADSKHSLSCIMERTVPQRVSEVTDLEPDILVTSPEGVEENTAAVYRITVDTTAISDISTVIQNPYPIGTRAECLQLICNAAGIVMRPARTEDISFLSTQTVSVRDISYDELLAEPEYLSQDEVHGATISCYDLQAGAEIALESVLASTTAKTRIELEHPVTNSAEILQFIYDSSGTEIGYVELAAQGYIAYVWVGSYDGTQQLEQATDDIVLWERKVQKTAVDKGVAPRKKLDNPLIDSSVLSSFWVSISQQLAQGSFVTIKHRGFPELDCGDKIRVQVKSEGEYVDAWVVQNKWEFKHGVLSGSTKLSLATGVG